MKRSKLIISVILIIVLVGTFIVWKRGDYKQIVQGLKKVVESKTTAQPQTLDEIQKPVDVDKLPHQIASYLELER